MTGGPAIAGDRMRELIEHGRARPLLPGRFPVPVLLDGHWWHQPADASDAVFVRAPVPMAAELAVLDARRRAADRAVEHASRHRER
ncbi:MAG: hypothetical protein ACT4RN_23395 [Pseudonocardia sp.]